MHKRRALLEALQLQLRTLPNFGGVFIQVVPPTGRFPCITVWPESEPVETLTIHTVPRPQERVLTVNITVWVKGTPDDEKAGSDLDIYAEKIEPVMSCPDDADELLLVGTSWTIDDEEPEIHTVVLTFRLTYQTEELNPT